MPEPPPPRLHEKHEGRIELDLANPGGPGVHLEKRSDGSWIWVARDPVLNSVIAYSRSYKDDIDAAKAFSRFVDAVLAGHYKSMEGYYRSLANKYYGSETDVRTA